MKRTIALLLGLLLLLTACTPKTAPADGTALTADPGSSSEQDTTDPPQPVVRHLAVAGDIMSHMPQVEDAYVKATGTYDYNHMFEDAAPLLSAADYAVGNLETVLGGGPTYSGYPNFSSPDALAVAAKNAGFDLLSTANNHTKDQGMDGIFRTLGVLDNLNLKHVGSYRSQAERNVNSGAVIADLNGITIAFLSYTYGLNGYRLADDVKYAVNLFNLDYYTDLEDFDYDLISADMAAARALNTDLIAVIMHWGVEYTDNPTSYQKQTARYLMEQGADIVLGGHPHVLERYETVTVTDVNGNEKDGFVVYSLGNFISNQQQEPATKTTVILDLELTKSTDGKTSVTDVSYTPFYMLHRDDLPAGRRRRLVNIHTAMAAYENGEDTPVTSDLYQRMKKALNHCYEVMGSEGDKYNR